MKENNGQPKKTQGRRKITIKAIEDKSKKLVTLSKRRNGIVNKASELSVRCGCEIAFITSNIGHDKYFGFGHPDVNTVLEKYINRTNSDAESEAENDPRTQKVKQEYIERLAKLEEEKKSLARAEEENENTDNVFLLDEPVNVMELEELELYRLGLMELKNKVTQRKIELMAAAAAKPYISDNFLGGSVCNTGGGDGGSNFGIPY